MIKKIKEKYRQRKLKRLIRCANILLWRIDKAMQKKSWSRDKRKQFWRDFVKSPATREQLFIRIVKLFE